MERLTRPKQAESGAANYPAGRLASDDKDPRAAAGTYGVSWTENLDDAGTGDWPIDRSVVWIQMIMATILSWSEYQQLGR